MIKIIINEPRWSNQHVEKEYVAAWINANLQQSHNPTYSFLMVTNLWLINCVEQNKKSKIYRLKLSIVHATHTHTTKG